MVTSIEARLSAFAMDSAAEISRVVTHHNLGQVSLFLCSVK